MLSNEKATPMGELSKLDEKFRRHVISSMSFWFGLCSLLVITPRYLISKMPLTPLISICSFAVLMFSIPVMIKKKSQTKTCANLLTLCLTGISITSGFFNGGMRAPAVPLLLLTPIIGFFSSGLKGAKLAFALVITCFVILVLGEHFALINPMQNPEKFSLMAALVYFFITFAGFQIGAAYEKSRKISEKFLADLSAKTTQSAKMSSLGEMASGISHEINNPLAIIHGKTGNLKKYLSSPNPDLAKARIELEKIENTTNRISKIIKGLKTFSRNSENDPKVATRLFSIFEDTLELCSARFQAHQIELRVGDFADVFIEARPAQISQIFLNLLSNSLDAVENLSEKWVAVSAYTKNNLVFIQVTDSGEGIAETVAEKMMQPFYTTKDVDRGTGLGLSISLGIARDHNGKLSYDKNAENTRFVLELPLSQMQRSPELVN